MVWCLHLGCEYTCDGLFYKRDTCSCWFLWLSPVLFTLVMNSHLLFQQLLYIYRGLTAYTFYLQCRHMSHWQFCQACSEFSVAPMEQCCLVSKICVIGYSTKSMVAIYKSEKQISYPSLLGCVCIYKRTFCSTGYWIAGLLTGLGRTNR